MNRKPTQIRNRPRSTRSEGIDSGLFRLAPLAVAAAALFAAPATHAATPAATPFRSMVAMQAGLVRLPDGSMSQWRGAERPVIGQAADGRPLMSIQQTQQKALLDWEKFELQANEVLEFRQQQADWIAVNRVHSKTASRVDGEIRATGRVFILNDNGVLMGEGAKVNTRQLATGSGIKDVDVDGGTTTLVQSQRKATLDWSHFTVQANEAVVFQQERNQAGGKSDWYAVNRGYNNSANRIDGRIEAAGSVYLFNDGGTVIGAGAVVDSADLVYGSGVRDVVLDGKTTTIVQGRDKAILNWRDMSLASGEKLRFQQDSKDWIALNRSQLSGATTQIIGDIQADGHLLLVSRQGLLLDGKIDAQQVIASSLDVRDSQFLSGQGLMSAADNYNDRFDPTFTNSWKYNVGGGWVTYGEQALLYAIDPAPEVVHPDDPLRYNVTVGRNGVISTASHGKVMLFGPGVTNKGIINVQDEGQVILAAGDNIYLSGAGNGKVAAYVGAYNPLSFMRLNVPYMGTAWRYGGPVTAEWVEFFNKLTEGTNLRPTTDGVSRAWVVGDVLPGDIAGAIYNRIVPYVNEQQGKRAEAVGFHARNEGFINAKRGGTVDFRGWNLEQMGSVDMTSTALFRGAISFTPVIYDWQEYANGSPDHGPLAAGNGNVVFGKGSLTQITPDLDSTDRIPVSQGRQSVGSLTINARSVHMQEDAMIHMPSGSMSVLLDSGGHVFSNRGNNGNTDNEDGTRFLMDRGATIDLSGWETTLDMGSHQVTGKLFAAQLKDSPLQRDGTLYRKEITVDRRYGTNLADWESFDNLSQGTLAQFLVDGGSFTMDVGDDFIMKPGSVIDVSGGKITYQEGFVRTTLLRRLDGSVIDIREADPDELYMGLANEWVVYDTKWQRQRSYYIPLMSSQKGSYEESYEHGGKAGSVEILAPDAVLLGTLRGETTVGRYQRAAPPAGGVFRLNQAGESESEYVSNNLLIRAIEQVLPDDFGMQDKLSDVYGDFFGEEFDHETDTLAGNGRLFDNGTLVSDDFFNRSSMGSYALRQDNRIDTATPGVPVPGVAAVVEQGVDIRLAHGASFSLLANDNLQFFGSIRTEGGDININASSLEFGQNSVLDTRGSWYSDYEFDKTKELTAVPRINGGDITISAGASDAEIAEFKLILPETMVIDASGGAWVDRNGKLKTGKGGNLAFTVGALDQLDISGLGDARAYGLGGNGGFSLNVGQNIYIGGEKPADDPASFLLAEAFFENSGFSSIALTTSAKLVVQDGVQVEATSASLRFKDPSLHNGVPSPYYELSGTDIYEIAEPQYDTPELRPYASRDGMDISLSASGNLKVGEGSLLATEAGGSLGLGGSTVDIHGTLRAPAGTISLSAGTEEVGTLTLHENARVLANGVARVLDRAIGPHGVELTDGEVLDGGQIVLRAPDLTIKQGAVLDVSGTSWTFDLAREVDTDVIVRLPRTVSSDGGSISVDGRQIDINDATFLAHAGGAGARGGDFSLTWGADYGVQRQNPWGPTPETAYDTFSYLFDYGYMVDLEGNAVTSFFGTDLSKIDWVTSVGMEISFAPGFSVASRADFVALLQGYDLAAAGFPPMLVIGDRLPAGQISSPPVDPGLRTLLEVFGYEFLPATSAPRITPQLSPDNIVAGGFSGLSLTAAPGLLFTGDASLGGKRENGDFVFDRISINAPHIMGEAGADVKISADIVTLSGGGSAEGGLYDVALRAIGLDPVHEDTRIAIEAGNLLQVDSAHFYGYSDTLLSSGGDIRLIGYVPQAGTSGVITGRIDTAGKLSLKADQIYAATGRNYVIQSGDTLTILPQDEGTPINSSPLEAAATLTLTAPRIVQGGTLRSPLGTINLTAIDDGTQGAGTVTLLPGSLTSVSAEGKTIPFGVTSNGDTWIDPLTGLELTNLPTKAINLKADRLDLQEGAVLDVQGGGDLYAWEFVPGIGGSTDWLTGYRDGDYNWVADGSEVYAVIPGYDADIAPVGLGNGGSNLAIGEKIYLSGGSGLPEGYYTLLPARYALLPGAFRVTAKHHYGSDYSYMLEGNRRSLGDGSSLQAGYRYLPGADGQPKYSAQRASGYLVMPGEALRLRSQYQEAKANSFYLSEAFLKKALRTNRPLGEIPRIPLDGGSVVLDAGKSINLDATLLSAAAEGGRGGFADIKGQKILVAGAGTDLALYDDYLVLDSERLNSFGAESLLLGGVRRQGAVNIEIDVGATDIVIDNQGTALSGPELLFASGGDIVVKDGAVVETKGQISGRSGDLRVLPTVARFVDNRGTDWEGDDVLVHEALDQGAVLRLSSGEQADVLRNVAAVDAMERLLADPAALEAANAKRAAAGLAPIARRGNLVVAAGAKLDSSRSLALDATNDTLLAPGANIGARQISASASRVSVGDVAPGTPGLVFSGGSLGALAAAEDILLKSYSTIDFHGPATLRADGRLALDTRNIRVLNAGDGTVTIAGSELALTNTNGGQATATTGSAKLSLEGKNIYLEGQDKWLSGVSSVDIKAEQRVIGRDVGTLYVPGALGIESADLTAESGAQLYFDATGEVNIRSNGKTDLPVFETLGAILGITGASVVNQGDIGLTGGTVNLRARSGDVTLTEGSSIDVTSNVSRIFDVDVGVGGGVVNLVSDRGDIDMAAGATIDVSGTAAGGDAGTLNTSAGLGAVKLQGDVKGNAGEGFRSGSFTMLSRSMGDFAALNAQLDLGGFRQGRRFEINEGDVNISGTVQVQEFAVVANDGNINVGGTIETVGDNGGRIQLSAAKDVTLASGGKLLARARSENGSGGTVFLETVGKDGGEISVAAGSTVDVSGAGEGGRTVRLRAPQIGGNDVAIAPVAGTIVGARSVIAEGFRVYEDVGTIDGDVIETVGQDAAAFMANAAAVQARLGSQVTLAPGIELRSDGDMELVEDWDLHELRFGSGRSAGVLTLRAKGDLKINANLSDGFDGAGRDAGLLNGDSWSINLAAGANTISPDSTAVLPTGQLEEGKGSIIIGGTPDTIEYIYDPTRGNEHRLYLIDANGRFINSGGWIELQRDPLTGKYIDPRTGALIEKDAATGDYVDTAYYSRRPLAWACYDYCSSAEGQDGNLSGTGNRYFVQQWDNSTGYHVRTGTASISLSSGRDLVLQERPSVIYTAGEKSADIARFYNPANADYSENGGDLVIKVAGDILAADKLPQTPAGWLARRNGIDYVTGYFGPSADRPYDQTTWYVDFGSYEAGIGALGGGNIDIAAGGSIYNLAVSIPNTARVTGNTTQDDPPMELYLTGGGDLSIRAGGDIRGGVYYVADGVAQLTAGGSFTSGASFRSNLNNGYAPNCEGGGCYTPADLRQVMPHEFEVYPMLYTSSGEFRLQSGGDLNIEAVMDPMLYNIWNYRGNAFMSYTSEARVSLFSAGGDVLIRNNALNFDVVEEHSSASPLWFPGLRFGGTGTDNRFNVGLTSAYHQLWPATLTAIAAAGDVQVLGTMTLAPSPQGNLELLAGNSVYIGYGTRAEDAFYQFDQPQNRSGGSGIFMSQAKVDLLRTTLNPLTIENYGLSAFQSAGASNVYGGAMGFTALVPPDLHAGDATPVRIYAGEGDIVTTAGINLPKQLWVQAGNHVYFPYFTVQHNNPNDLTLVRAGNGLYFTGNGFITLSGPGRMEIETGGDFWIPSNGVGITSNSIALTNGQLWRPDEKSADIAISTGFNQLPSYEAFEDAYFNPELAAEMEEFLLADAGDGRKLSVYLFDRIYARGNGSSSELASPELSMGFVNYMRSRQGLPPLETAAEQTAYLAQAWDAWLNLPWAEKTPYDGLVPRMTETEATAKGARPEFYLSERREGLVNYVRRLQGLEALRTQEEQLAYLDQAWGYWETLDTDFKTPMIRNAFFMELRTTGREANDVDSDRNNTTFRGYNAIAKLFPGAQKRATEELAEGESRWAGDFETYASRVISNGGGKVEFVIPGGAFTLANAAARPGETGQPEPDWSGNMGRGNALRSGVITQDGGEINIFTHGSVTVNESRILTTKGGNALIWSSYGDIAAGKGAKTSISPPFYDYTLNGITHMNRVPAGLPTGAGIGTLATQPGTPPADVDLIAPNGIVDAGDAGLRVSGNFNVFAVQILGTDNIEVQGISTGLPVPPSAPPTSLNIDDAAAKTTKVTDALTESMKKAKADARIKGPSIIEVKILGHGENCAEKRKDCEPGT